MGERSSCGLGQTPSLGAQPTHTESGSYAALLELRGGVVNISRIGHITPRVASAFCFSALLGQETDEIETVYRSAAFRRANLRCLGLSVLRWDHLPIDGRRLLGS